MKPHVKYGLIGAVILAVWTLVGYVMGNEMSHSLRWVGYIVILGVMIFCLRAAISDRKYFHNGYITFKQAFGTAMLTSLIIWAVSSVFTYIYFSFLNPEMIDFIVEKSREEMEMRGGMTEEQMEMALNMQAKFMTPMMMALMSFVMMMLMSIVVSLIMAAVMKKENPEGIFAEQNNQPS